MSNAVNRAYAASRKAHKKAAGVSVVISRSGVGSSGAVTATLGFNGDNLSENTDMATTYSRFCTFFIDVADYNVGGSAVVPQRYDTIQATIGGVASTFQVLDGNADSSAKYEGLDRLVWRIYTEELS